MPSLAGCNTQGTQELDGDYYRNKHQRSCSSSLQAGRGKYSPPVTMLQLDDSRLLSRMERLPYDVLREIVLYAKNYRMEYDKPKFEIQVLAPPITASHVCRSWRRALLSDSTMWTCLAIPETNADGIVELLRRSGSAPLNVFIDLYKACERSHDYEGTLDLISILSEHIHRFSVLRLEIEYLSNIECWEGESFEDLFEKSVSVIMSSIQQPAPALRTFSFWYAHLQVDEEHDPDHTIIENLFSGIAPNLKRVHHRLSLEPQETRTGVFSDLLELCLAVCSSMQPDLFFDLLEASPRLNVLRIYALDRFKLDQSSDRKVHLPHLKRLALDVTEAPDIVDLFMSHATFPLNVKWRISAPFFEKSPTLLQLLSQTRLTYLHAELGRQFSSLRFEELEPALDRDKFNGNALIHEYYSIKEMVELIDQNMPIINFECITYVELEANFLLSYGLIPFIFAKLTKLESLTFFPARFAPIATDEILNCLHALSIDPEDMGEGTDDNIDPVEIPELNSDLVDSNVTFNPQIVVHCPTLRTIELRLSSPLEIKHAEIVTKFLGIRCKAGYPLEILLYCPSIQEEAERVLQQWKLDGALKVHIIPSE